MRKQLIEKFERCVFVLEITIAIVLFIGVAIGIFEFVNHFNGLLTAQSHETYELFEEFLAYALILVVGIELILTILYHSTRVILELVLFVIARKMLIYSRTMQDLMFGTVAILLVFFVFRFLVNTDQDDIVRKATDHLKITKGFNHLFPVREPSEESSSKPPSLQELAYHLCLQQSIPIKVGAQVECDQYKLHITEVDDDGKIVQVEINAV